MRPLSPAEVGRFLEAARGDEHEALFVLAVSSGMRQGELLALRAGRRWIWRPERCACSGRCPTPRTARFSRPPRPPRAADASSSPVPPSRPSDATGRPRTPTGSGWARCGKIKTSSS
jgi:hypothetical protein